MTELFLEGLRRGLGLFSGVDETGGAHADVALAVTLPELDQPGAVRGEEGLPGRDVSRSRVTGQYLRQVVQGGVLGHGASLFSRRALLYLRESATATRLVTDLASGTCELTHEALDARMAGQTDMAVDYFRAVLVSAGILPVRDEYMARLERWIERLLGISPAAAGRWAAGAIRSSYAAEVALRSDG